MEIVASIIVAMITGACSIAAALAAARNTRTAVLQKLELQQAVQSERVESYQRTTNEKIDKLSEQVSAQAAYGTRIALLESKVERLEGGH